MPIVLTNGRRSIASAGFFLQFNGTANPITQGVAQTGLDGLDWTAPRMSGGCAFSSQVSPWASYDDSVAYYDYVSNGNYRITSTLKFTGTRDGATNSHEVENLGRGLYTAHSETCIHTLLGYSGATGWYAQIFTLNGAIGDFTEIGAAQNTVPDVVDGDLFITEFSGTSIKSYLKQGASAALLLSQATSSAYTGAGRRPGNGYFWRGTENANDFGIKSVLIEAM